MIVRSLHGALDASDQYFQRSFSPKTTHVDTCRMTLDARGQSPDLRLHDHGRVARSSPFCFGLRPMSRSSSSFLVGTLDTMSLKSVLGVIRVLIEEECLAGLSRECPQVSSLLQRIHHQLEETHQNLNQRESLLNSFAVWRDFWRGCCLGRMFAQREKQLRSDVDFYVAELKSMQECIASLHAENEALRVQAGNEAMRTNESKLLARIECLSAENEALRVQAEKTSTNETTLLARIACLGAENEKLKIQADNERIRITDSKLAVARRSQSSFVSSITRQLVRWVLRSWNTTTIVLVEARCKAVSRRTAQLAVCTSALARVFGRIASAATRVCLAWWCHAVLESRMLARASAVELGFRTKLKAVECDWIDAATRRTLKSMWRIWRCCVASSRALEKLKVRCTRQRLRIVAFSDEKSLRACTMRWRRALLRQRRLSGTRSFVAKSVGIETWRDLHGMLLRWKAVVLHSKLTASEDCFEEHAQETTAFVAQIERDRSAATRQVDGVYKKLSRLEETLQQELKDKQDLVAKLHEAHLQLRQVEFTVSPTLVSKQTAVSTSYRAI